MKQILITCLIMMTLTGANTAGVTTSSPPPQVIVLHKKSPLSSRPRLFTPEYLECYYEDGVIEFLFNDSIDFITVQILQDGCYIWDGTVTSTNNLVYTSSFTGDCIIECTTPTGEIFQGYISF